MNNNSSNNETTRPNERRVSFTTLVAYGLGDIYGGGSFTLISILFIFFLTDVVGLSALQAGQVAMIGKIWDAFSDPLMGYFSDRTRTRWGRRRIFFLVGIVPIAISFSLLWLPLQFDNSLFTFLYYSTAYLFFSTVFTMVMVPYAALNAEITRDYKARTRLSAARMVFSGVGTGMASILPNLIVGAFEEPTIGYPVMGCSFALMFALPWLAVFFGTWEAVEPEPNQVSNISDFFRSLKSLFVNRSFRIHLGMYIGAYTGIDILMAFAMYYMTYFFGRQELFFYCMITMMVTQLLSLIVYVFIANRYGKGRAYTIGLTIWIVVLIFGLLLDQDASNWIVITLFGLVGLGLSAGLVMPWAILPSVTDVDELITSKQRAGVYAGAMTLLRKLVQAVVLFMVGFMLNQIGYVPNQTQTPDTVDGLRLLFHLGPTIFLAIGIGFALFFRITPRTHRILSQEIKRFQSGSDANQTSLENQKVCEQLTGLPFHKLYKPR